MLVTNLYKVPPYVVSPSLKSSSIVLLVVPKNWRILLISQGHSVRMCFIVSRVSMGCLLYSMSLLRPILNLVKHVSHRLLSHAVLGSMYISSVISDNLFACVAFHFSLYFSLYVFLMYALRSLLVCSNCVLSV